MAQPRLSNVDVPVLAHINGMFPGRIITINGTVNDDAERFSVNFLTAADSDADNAFHFNPRFNEGLVVRNTKEGGSWQQEEREGDKFRFKLGEPFEISIKCRKQLYKVRVNGKSFCDFRHRIPMHDVAYLKIGGGVSVQSVDFQEENNISAPSVSFKDLQPGDSHDIPFRNIRGHSMYIIGKPTDGEKFAINFMLGNGDIALHINPRFEEQAIVRNSKLDGEWGSEERDLPEDFPFARNSPFMFRIDVDGEGFKVKLNGIHQFDYAHRVRPIKRIKSVQVAQDGAEIRELSFF